MYLNGNHQRPVIYILADDILLASYCQREVDTVHGTPVEEVLPVRPVIERLSSCQYTHRSKPTEVAHRRVGVCNDIEHVPELPSTRSDAKILLACVHTCAQLCAVNGSVRAGSFAGSEPNVSELQYMSPPSVLR
jgi:hypothetical protein